MTKEEIMIYTYNSNGNLCIDLRFDWFTRTVQATEISCTWKPQLRQKVWEVRLRYLLFFPDTNLNGTETQAYIVGKYDDLDTIISNLEPFIGATFEQWFNFTKNGYFITLNTEQLSHHKAIEWKNWLPSKILVPKGSEYVIRNPEGWKDKVRLIND
jgi:hypothetical protein